MTEDRTPSIGPAEFFSDSTRLRWMSQLFAEGLDPILIEDLDGRIADMNEEAERVYGWKREELLGKPVLTVVPPENHALADALLTRCRLGESVRNEPGRRCDKAGVEFPARITLLLLRDDQGEPIGVANVCRDASEVSSLRSAWSVLAGAGHEIRTPMNAILGYSEMLLQEAEDADEPIAEDLRKIHAAGQAEFRLIQEVLGLAKIEAGELPLFKEIFELRPVLEEAAAISQPVFEKSGSSLTLSIESGGSLETDLAKFKQMLLLLLHNAATADENGSVTLTVRGDPDWITLEISDLNRAGLGFAVAARFCEMIGGAILPGKSPDSAAIVRIPGITAPAVQSKEAGVVDAAGPLLLIIDDESSALDLIRDHLRDEGFSVLTAASGAQGLSLARDARPALISVNVMMAGMEGWQVLRELKADSQLRDIPVEMISVLGETSMGFAPSVADYLVKPINRDQLRTLTKRHLGGSNGGRVLIVEDEPETRELLRRILQQDGFSVEEANNGVMGLECLDSQIPDLIILDLMMPQMDGFEFTAALRSEPRWSGIPVIVSTARDLSSEDMVRLGGSLDEVLRANPRFFDEFVSRIRNLLTIPA